MKAYAVAWRPRASHELAEVRAFLGLSRVALLNQELEHVRERLSANPESAPRAYLRNRTHPVIRRLVMIRNPYHLYYRVEHDRQRVVIMSIWHEKRREPRL